VCSSDLGTLTVNVIGSLLIGFLSAVLIVERVAFSAEYRSGILVGVLGGFTTFSSFSLETINLVERGLWLKAGVNIVLSISVCLLATGLGLWLGRFLSLTIRGLLHSTPGQFPYLLVSANGLMAFLIGLITSILFNKLSLSLEYRAAILVLMVGGFATLSSLYLALQLIEQGFDFMMTINKLLWLLSLNTVSCVVAVGLASLVGKHF
jgi:CrcB protein